MPHYHSTHPRLCRGRLNVLLVGCGGNGSRMLLRLAELARTLSMLGHPGLQVTVIDGDEVSEPNLARQPFTAADLGRSKAYTLVTRVNLCYGLGWDARHAYVEDSGSLDGVACDLVITCVDSRSARAKVFEAVRVGSISGQYQFRPAYLLDLGNDRTTGQYALGTCGSGHAVPLPTAAEMWPEIADASADVDDGPSCSSEEAVRRQDLFVNDVLACQAANLLWRLLRDGRVEHHGGFVNLFTGVVAPIPVPAAACPTS